MGDPEPEAVQDRTRRHRSQARARDQELGAQAEEPEQEDQSRMRAWKTRQAAAGDMGLEVGDPRAQQEDGHRPRTEETGTMGVASSDTASPARRRREDSKVHGTGDLAGQLSELARTLQHEQDMDATLAAMVYAALELIPGAAAASISVARAHHTMTSHAASSELAAVVDQLQEEHGEGPCLDAAYVENIVRVPDFGQENRWPSFAPAAAEAGARSMLCFQLYTDERELGALNVYGAETEAFTATSEEVGLLVAAHAAVAFADAEQIARLHRALTTRDLIGRAKGILMERFKITDQQAFVVLTTASSRSNLKLREVAEQLATTGTFPGEH
ncbi:GAF and ANTAR domain-containing protein [Kocuria sabuli]|uniref:GAF and ANTAR domain-containing protein n=1 Tax=Kocuria sabuli TaxID=3071448 RepID=UPI0034D4220B